MLPVRHAWLGRGQGVDGRVGKGAERCAAAAGAAAALPGLGGRPARSRTASRLRCTLHDREQGAWGAAAALHQLLRAACLQASWRRPAPHGILGSRHPLAPPLVLPPSVSACRPHTCRSAHGHFNPVFTRALPPLPQLAYDSSRWGGQATGCTAACSSRCVGPRWRQGTVGMVAPHRSDCALGWAGRRRSHARSRSKRAWEVAPAQRTLPACPERPIVPHIASRSLVGRLLRRVCANPPDSRGPAPCRPPNACKPAPPHPAVPIPWRPSG